MPGNKPLNDRACQPRTQASAPEASRRAPDRGRGKALPWSLIALVLAGLALAAAWRFTSLGDLISPVSLDRWMQWARQHPLTPLVVWSLYVMAGLVVFPITLLVVATAWAFGPVWGVGYALSGALLSAAVTFALGRRLGHPPVHRMLGNRAAQVSPWLERRGLWTIMLVRVVPVAPFTLINLAAGAAAVRWRAFLAGTVLGMAPGMLLIALFIDRLAELWRNPAWSAAWILVPLVWLALGLHLWSRRRLRAGRGD